MFEITTPSPVSTGFALVLLAGLPALAAMDARRGIELEDVAEHRRALYASVAISLLIICGLTAAVVAWQPVEAGDLGWSRGETLDGFGWGIGTAAAGLALIWLLTRAARMIGLAESPLARALMPLDAGEKSAFLLLSGVAAVCEEFVFRGFLLWAVAGWTGSPWFAAAVVSLSFGLAHGYQKLAGVARAGALGMALAVPTIVTGSLFPAIVAHFWINAAVGMGGWRYLLPESDELDELSEEDAASGGSEEEDRRTG